MGMESPETACHSEHVTASSVQADDSYRNVLAVGVRSEAAGGGFFCCPGTAKEGATSNALPDRLSGWRPRRSTAARGQRDFRATAAFPYHTMFENVSGSFVMGALAGYFAFRGSAPQHWQLFLTTGILGGYTTFSAFSLDTALRYERSGLALPALYVVGSVALSIAGLFGGLALARHYF